MSDLLETYNTSVLDGIVKARAQSEGAQAHSYFDGTPRGRNNTSPDEFQSEFTTRPPGSKEIFLSVGDDDTDGTWLERALNWYAELIQNNKLTTGRSGQSIHSYNARQESSHYGTVHSTARGIMSQSS
jgi:hypothetical protein